MDFNSNTEGKIQLQDDSVTPGSAATLQFHQGDVYLLPLISDSELSPVLRKSRKSEVSGPLKVLGHAEFTQMSEKTKLKRLHRTAKSSFHSFYTCRSEWNDSPE